jgi:hypothetical protein
MDSEFAVLLCASYSLEKLVDLRAIFPYACVWNRGRQKQVPVNLICGVIKDRLDISSPERLKQ